MWERQKENWQTWHFIIFATSVCLETHKYTSGRKERGGVDGRHTKTKTPNNACEEKWSQASLYYLEGSGSHRVCID